MVTLTDGRAEIEAEAPLTIAAVKPSITAIDWVVTRTTHTINDQGFTTHIEAEPRVL